METKNKLTSRYIRTDGANDVFLITGLSVLKYVRFPRTMEMTEKDVLDFYIDELVSIKEAEDAATINHD